MIYLLDANVLIDANRDYYPIERIPEFWEWLVYNGNSGLVKIPFEVFNEIKDGDDELAKWAKREETNTALMLNEEVDITIVQRVLRVGYADDLTDVDVQKLGCDPLLVAYALNNNNMRCVVTTEVSKPKKQRANKHIPDVCDSFSIMWCHTFEFIRALGFSTNWRKLV